jgi:hypothetical protein
MSKDNNNHARTNVTDQKINQATQDIVETGKKRDLAITNMAT